MAETFVLVHGAWHGGWCWAAVINQLEKLGDNAYAVDLPGHGMNRADRSKVTLASYVDSVAQFIERHDLKNVVLAGHSLGGLTIPGVAAKIPSRIKRVVWVTAMVPLDGQPIIDPATSPLAAGIDSMPERSVTIEMMGKEFLDGLANDSSLATYPFLPAARADLLEKLGRLDEARAEFERAASLTENATQRARLLLRARDGDGKRS